METMLARRRKSYGGRRSFIGKVRPGFTLMETMLAMVIIGIVLTPIFLLHGTIMQRMNRSSKQLYALLWGKQLLHEARKKQEPEAHEFSLEKKIEESAVQLKYVLHKSVDQKSSLISQEGLHKELVTISWTDQGRKYDEQLVAYVYKKPEQKKS
jgi:prepilin-type N-terminal cleavage/methylation domain-containing protein